jgi:hypothetical protein
MQFDLQPGIHVTPRVDYTKFDVSSLTARRRSVYRFLFRTLPDPFMDALDCPAGDQLTPARNASVTVQQALAMWNNAFVSLWSVCQPWIARNTKEGSTRLRSVGRPPGGGGGVLVTPSGVPSLSAHFEQQRVHVWN